MNYKIRLHFSVFNFVLGFKFPTKKSKTKKSRALNLKIWAKLPANGHLFFRPRLRRGSKKYRHHFTPFPHHSSPLRCDDPDKQTLMICVCSVRCSQNTYHNKNRCTFVSANQKVGFHQIYIRYFHFFRKRSYIRLSECTSECTS